MPIFPHPKLHKHLRVEYRLEDGAVASGILIRPKIDGLWYVRFTDAPPDLKGCTDLVDQSQLRWANA